MAKVILAPFIQSISGKVGNFEFRTLKSGRTVVRARRETESQPSRPLTQKEIAQRRRFGLISSVVAAVQRTYPRIDQAALDRKKIWQKVAYYYAKYADSVTDDAKLFDILLEMCAN